MNRDLKGSIGRDPAHGDGRMRNQSSQLLETIDANSGARIVL